MIDLVVMNNIKKSFHYLFKDYEFEVVIEEKYESFGNWLVVLHSDRCCRIRIYEDRGEMFVSLGPTSSPPNLEDGSWFDLSVVMAFLLGRQNQMEYELGKLDWSNLGKLDWQLERLSRGLHPHMNQICELFRLDVFEQRKEALAQLAERMRAEFLKRFSGDK